MANIQNVTPGMTRIDYSRSDVYLRPDAPKLTFWQKFTRGLGKGLGYLGPIGAAVTAIALPGIGLPIAGGLYGLSRVASDSVGRAEAKDQIAMASQPKPQAYTLPGLFDTMPQTPGEMATDFIGPSEVKNVVYDRTASQQQAVVDFQSTSAI